MKSFLLPALLVLTVSSMAQGNISITHTVNDDGKTLSIKITGTANGKAIDYDRAFDVKGMRAVQKNALKDKVYDSLGLHAPALPHMSVPSQLPNTAEPTISSVSRNNELYTIGGNHPFTKEIRYNPQTGLLHMKYRFVENKEEILLERSIDAKDKTKEERDQIIKKYEQEIGLRAPEII
jgi:hypothetical protein